MIDDVIVCPVCHCDLDDVSCTNCGRRYVRREHTLDLTPHPPPDDRVRERWPLWEQLQANGSIAYDADPDANLSMDTRDDSRAFGAFARLEGTVLDVGCGPQEIPVYAERFSGRFIGIDPLLGVQPRAFDFVQGLAEYLPFRTAEFDRVLFAGTLDHMLDPLRALQEARRVLKPTGEIAVWYGTPEENQQEGRGLWRKGVKVAQLTVRGDVRGIYRRVRLRMRGPSSLNVPRPPFGLSVPNGAIDEYHFYHLEQSMLDSWLAESSLRCVHSERITLPYPSRFVRLVPGEH